MNAHDILKQKILDTEEDHTTGITREEVQCIQSKLESLHGELTRAINIQGTDREIAELFRSCAELKFGPMPFPRKFYWEIG